ncbi:IS30 family transposase [Enterococcus sp. CWB-B31]|uniref:IS30 family transposase n=1 Tax=Enterococcus sp. CWB-B31 TaxID=2885159 RepID=UPI001E4681BC|nr:IS30 family transposase [Enterococcus sp. CWB-B31]MCB5954429.1 IS30 family transposase [Enterococcus sp. CWB-B31]
MTYTHLTPNELVMIEAYFNTQQPVAQVAKRLGRARQTIYNVYHFLAAGYTALEYYQQYKAHKSRCGRRSIVLPDEQKDYIQTKVTQGWTPDVLIGCGEFPIDCSIRTLYRMFRKGLFDCSFLPLKGKRKPNGHKEKRGKQAFRRTIDEREQEYPHFCEEFGHLEGDTIVGAHHKSAVITLVERQSKAIVTLKPNGHKAKDIETTLNEWFSTFPKNLFKSITFDCGKEFSNWKSISNKQDIDIYFADPGTPSQRGLNEHSNGLLRKDGLPKQMNFNEVDEAFVQSVASKRNHIPRKSLNYRTPMEVFLSYMDDEMVSRLI